MPIDPDTRPDPATLAFRLAQLDTYEQVLLRSHYLYTPEMRASLGLIWLNRIWQHYREDRALATGEALCGAECTAERNAFLSLLEAILPPDDTYLTIAIRFVRQIAIHPLRQEYSETAKIVAANTPTLTTVIDALSSRKLSHDPVERLFSLVNQFSYSTADDSNIGAATAFTPCWALNLVTAVNSQSFYLTRNAIPIPGILKRWMFRADRNYNANRLNIAASVEHAIHTCARDIAVVQRADQTFKRDFNHLRSHSRLYRTWLLLYALREATPAQLARALPATKAGAAKLLRQLVKTHFAHEYEGHRPYACAIHFPISITRWNPSTNFGEIKEPLQSSVHR